MKYYASDLKWYGRYLDHKDIRYFDYSASGFEFCFTGKRAECTILSDPSSWNETNKGVLGIFVTEINPSEYNSNSFWNHIDNEPVKRVTLSDDKNKIILFDSEEIMTVVIKVLKISEAAFGYAGFESLETDGELITSKPDNTNHKKIEFIGDSITCGYGIEGIYLKDGFTTQQERPDKAYAYLTAKELNAEFNLVSWSGIGIISNYVDPATVNLPDTHWLMPALWPYTDKSLSLRLKLEPSVWDESAFSPDIVVIHLGTNDASFVRDVEERRLAYVSGLRQLIEAVHRRSPKAKICCCLGVMGQLLCDSVEEAVNLFKKDFPNIEVKSVKFPAHHEDTTGVAADWHPTAKTHESVAKALAAELKTWI